MLMRMWSNGNSHSLLVGMQNDTTTLEDSLAVSYKTKHNLIWSSNRILKYLPKWAENVHLPKNLHKNVYSSFVRICQNLGANKMSFCRWMGKQAVVYPYNGILFSDKKKWTIKPWKDMEETYKIQDQLTKITDISLYQK